MAGSDTDRLNDLNNAFRDPKVRAILTTRGGAGAYRIADDIDFTTVRSDPKPLIGFSSLNGEIHFLEYNKASLGTVDRYITQLIRSGALDGLVGVVLGSFECLRDFSDRGWNIIDVCMTDSVCLMFPCLAGSTLVMILSMRTEKLINMQFH